MYSGVPKSTRTFMPFRSFGMHRHLFEIEIQFQQTPGQGRGDNLSEW